MALVTTSVRVPELVSATSVRLGPLLASFSYRQFALAWNLSSTLHCSQSDHPFYSAEIRHPNLARATHLFTSKPSSDMLSLLGPAVRSQVEATDRSGRLKAHRTLFLVTEYLPVSLKAVVVDAGADELPMGTVVAILSDIGEALLSLQDKRMLHLDVCLENVAVTPGPRAVLTNFDRCILLPSDDFTHNMEADLMATSGVLGNAEHLAPEVHAAFKLQPLSNGRVQVDLSKQAGVAVNRQLPVCDLFYHDRTALVLHAGRFRAWCGHVRGLLWVSPAPRVPWWIELGVFRASSVSCEASNAPAPLDACSQDP
jgi:hypothetical protein